MCRAGAAPAHRAIADRRLRACRLPAHGGRLRAFRQASGRIADITQHDASFTDAPLFTKDLALSGDAVAEAAALVTRLENHAGLTAALEAATITPREYAKFTITLIVARLAHGFLKAGVLPRVPSGAPTMNVEFVKTHESEVIEALARLGIRD